LSKNQTFPTPDHPQGKAKAIHYLNRDLRDTMDLLGNQNGENKKDLHRKHTPKQEKELTPIS